MRGFQMAAIGVVVCAAWFFVGAVKTDVEYGNVGGESLKLDVGVPEGVAEGEKLPLAIVVHGGGWSGGIRRRILWGCSMR